VRIVKIEKTSNCYPARWEGYTDDNRPVYISYRRGYLHVVVGNPGESSKFMSMHKVFRQKIGEICNGFLNYDQLRERCFGFAIFPDREIKKV